MADRDDLETERHDRDVSIRLGRQAKAATAESGQLGELALLRLPQVLAILPISRSTWWDGVKRGRFPAPVRIGPRTTAWRASDIRELIASLDGGPMR
jgi:prophage regulatory protein